MGNFKYISNRHWHRSQRPKFYSQPAVTLQAGKSPFLYFTTRTCESTESPFPVCLNGLTMDQQEHDFEKGYTVCHTIVSTVCHHGKVLSTLL